MKVNLNTHISILKLIEGLNEALSVTEFIAVGAASSLVFFAVEI